MDSFSSPSSSNGMSGPSTEVLMDQLKTQLNQAYAEEFIEVSEMAASTKQEVFIPPLWEEAACSITFDNQYPPVAIVCGPKNSGKSTFSRFLLNTLLQRYRKVAYLDTDVGQPDFFLPGCLSLHIIDECLSDLATTGIRSPERCCFFGDISSKRDPQSYLSCVYDIYDHFIEAHCKSKDLDDSMEPSMPLIVNTPGWVKGTGFDLLVEMLRRILPTHVVQIRISVESKNLPLGVFWSHEKCIGSVKLFAIASARQDTLNRSVLIHKDAQWIRSSRLFEYFKQCFPSNLNIETMKELAHYLTVIPPYEVPLSKIKVKHLHFLVSDNEIAYSLNATIVGLAIGPGGSEFTNTWCVGLGIVRGVDTMKDRVYLITPVSYCILRNVNILLQGLIQIPTGLLQVRGCVSPYMSTNVLQRFG